MQHESSCQYGHEKVTLYGRGFVNGLEHISRCSQIYLAATKGIGIAEKDIWRLCQCTAWCVCVGLRVTKMKQRESEWVLWAITQLICAERSGMTLPDLLQSPLLWARIQPTSEWTKWNDHPGLYRPLHNWQKRQESRKQAYIGIVNSRCRVSAAAFESQASGADDSEGCFAKHKGRFTLEWRHPFLLDYTENWGGAVLCSLYAHRE